MQTKAPFEKLRTSWSPVLDKTRREALGKHPEWGQAGMLPLEAPQGTPATCSAGLTQGHTPTGTSRPPLGPEEGGGSRSKTTSGLCPILLRDGLLLHAHTMLKPNVSSQGD